MDVIDESTNYNLRWVLEEIFIIWCDLVSGIVWISEPWCKMTGLIVGIRFCSWNLLLLFTFLKIYYFYWKCLHLHCGIIRRILCWWDHGQISARWFITIYHNDMSSRIYFIISDEFRLGLKSKRHFTFSTYSSRSYVKNIDLHVHTFIIIGEYRPSCDIFRAPARYLR